MHLLIGSNVSNLLVLEQFKMRSEYLGNYEFVLLNLIFKTLHTESLLRVTSNCSMYDDPKFAMTSLNGIVEV